MNETKETKVAFNPAYLWWSDSKTLFTRRIKIAHYLIWLAKRCLLCGVLTLKPASERASERVSLFVEASCKVAIHLLFHLDCSLVQCNAFENRK